MCPIDPDIDYTSPIGTRGYGASLGALGHWLDVDWQVINSGGRCQLIVNDTLLEAGLLVQVSDRTEPLSPYPHRTPACRGGRSVGWAVGIYAPATDYCEAHGWAESTDNHADVVALVRDALQDYRRHRPTICDCRSRQSPTPGPERRADGIGTIARSGHP